MEIKIYIKLIHYPHYHVILILFLHTQLNTMPDFSKFKVLLLVLVYVACAYTAFQRFYSSSGGTQYRTTQQPLIQHSVCRKFIGKAGTEEDSVRCREAVDRANIEAKSKCSQYFSQLTTCQSRTRAPCQTQLSNFENCVNTILTHTVKAEFDKPKI